MFRDRRDAGIRLAERLGRYAAERPVVVALPRGGVPVAREVARALHAPLDILVVRKLGYPAQPELGMGAVGEGGVRVVNDDLVERLQVSRSTLDQVTEREAAEVRRRVRRWRGDQPPMPVSGRTVILVDDGLATGFTARAGIAVLRHAGAARVVLAVPVASPDTVSELRLMADEVECLSTPEWFMAIGQWYEDFRQVPDEVVAELLAESRQASVGESSGPPPTEPAGRAAGQQPREVAVRAGDVRLPGDLTIPPEPSGLVIFAHGSGSSRRSPRNRAVAAFLNDGGMATLLLDLLTPQEAERRDNVFNVDLLAGRLVSATRWAHDQPGLDRLPVGYFGASTGAAAALVAAARLGGDVTAVVSRGGRPDLAGERVDDVTAPTLLIVGEADGLVLRLNEKVRQVLRCESDLAVVPAAGHLFEEPGALEEVSMLARDWFAEHLGVARTPATEGD